MIYHSLIWFVVSLISLERVRAKVGLVGSNILIIQLQKLMEDNNEVNAIASNIDDHEHELTRRQIVTKEMPKLRHTAASALPMALNFSQAH